MANSINWFELPATNFSRAVKFYSTILEGTIQVHELDNGGKMGLLPNFDQEKGIGGHIGFGLGGQPSENGTMVYLNGGNDLNDILNKVDEAGGKVLLPKTASPGGFMGVFLDTEGNRVAVHNP